MSEDKSNEYQQQPKKENLGRIVNFTVTTTEIPMETKTTESSIIETKDTTVTIPVVTRCPGVKPKKLTEEEILGEKVTVPATEVKKITTIQTVVPKKIQTVEMTEYEPRISDSTEGNSRNIQITTPIERHTTTTTTLLKTTTIKNEITTIIGPDSKLQDKKII